jgi:hypothetical protein
MIKPLRKYHYVTWAILALLLPLAFVAALGVMPTQQPDTKKEADTFSAHLSFASDSTMNLTINVGAPIKAPSCLAVLSMPQRDLVLGSLNNQGTYSFIVPSAAASGMLNLVDVIHHRTIATIPLANNTNTK